MIRIPCRSLLALSAASTIFSAPPRRSDGGRSADMQRHAALLRRALTVRHARLGMLRLPSCTLPLAAMLTEVELELMNLAAHVASGFLGLVLRSLPRCRSST
ncbi:MAG: hypothetical protein JNM84_25800 [Planctomycetes bacterium]|nr:hypothetical protein [Planctomycetota bacterium]